MDYLDTIETEQFMVDGYRVEFEVYSNGGVDAWIYTDIGILIENVYYPDIDTANDGIEVIIAQIKEIEQELFYDAG